MDISITVLNETGGIAHRSHMSVDGLMLTVAAESRQDIARAKGPDWTHGAITHYGSEILDAVRMRKPNKELELSTYNLAMAVWVFGSVFGEQTTEQFVDSDLAFTITPDGIVRYDKHR